MVFTELIREERINDLLDFFEQDRRKFKKTRFIFAFLLLILGFLIFSLHPDIPFLLIPIAGFVIGYKYPYYSLMSKKRKQDILNAYLFPEFVQSFIALIPTSSNVYQTLLAVYPYTKEPLKSKLGDLIQKIQKENKREYYLEFAEFINTSEAFMVMDMIYQFSQFGIKKESLKELQNYMSEIQKNRMDEIINKKMNSMENYAYFPIFIPLTFIVSFAALVLLYYWSQVSSAVSGI